jgi:hypothetical protein
MKKMPVAFGTMKNFAAAIMKTMSAALEAKKSLAAPETMRNFPVAKKKMNC